MFFIPAVLMRLHTGKLVVSGKGTNSILYGNIPNSNTNVLARKVEWLYYLSVLRDFCTRVWDVFAVLLSYHLYGE